ncbi:Zn-dependent alcohol dehydrogenase [Labrenzia sp. EL_13]|nr:Zn-dependent alcohol dehydrogenase [Labrenzia sp. EL_13]
MPISFQNTSAYEQKWVQDQVITNELFVIFSARTTGRTDVITTTRVSQTRTIAIFGYGRKTPQKKWKFRKPRQKLHGN